MKDKLLPKEPQSPSPTSGKSPQPNDAAKQQDHIEKVKQAEEQNRRLAGVARLAEAEAEAEAAIREFSVRNYPIVLDPSPRQIQTLAVLFREKVTAEEIDAYLELMEAGVGLYLIEEKPGSLRRLRSLLDAAAQVAVGSNVGEAIQGQTRKERLRSFADLLRSSPPFIGDQSVGDFRKRVLRYPSLPLS